MLTVEQKQAWNDSGFFVIEGFADPSLCEAMLDRVRELAQAKLHGEDIAVYIAEEPKLAASASPDALERVGKVFKLHDDTVFAEFARDPRVLDLVGGVLGPRLDCFLSQFIFKNPGALGQPWHQDSHYFPFEPDHQVGVWLSVTKATIENGCLWVLPGSHIERVHDHVPDRREYAQGGYVEIVDHDMAAGVPVLMDPGDVLFFDSHVMHRSTDNESNGIRAAMVYHYSPTGTVRHHENAIYDWITVR
jgi:phytanoyl-CoA hydroxylase